MDTQKLLQDIRDNIAKVVVGKAEAVDLILAALIAALALTPLFIGLYRTKKTQKENV